MTAPGESGEEGGACAVHGQSRRRSARYRRAAASVDHGGRAPVTGDLVRDGRTVEKPWLVQSTA